MNEKMTPLSPEESGEVEFNGFTARVTGMGPTRTGKFRIWITRKYPSTPIHEVYAWGTLMEAKAHALGIMETLALMEDLIADGATLPLGIGEGRKE
jgi:hypothetical protein